jgi:hypothetical protein
MRLSILSRSAIAAATLAVGSAALVAAPAEAASPSGITREQVLAAASAVRSTPMTTPGSYGSVGNRAIKGIVNRACSVDPEGPESYYGSIVGAAQAGASADGVVITAIFTNPESGSFNPNSVCTFGVLTTSAPRSVLNGTATIGSSAPAALSGDVFVTPAVRTVVGSGSPDSSVLFPTFTASGAAVQSTDVKVADKKSKKQKKAAKAKYDKKLSSLEKSYDKALKKAGSSKSKKSAAKKTYTAKKKAAKAAYKYAIASYKIVVKKTATPFNVTAKSPVTP